jgi:hypothetical protein
MRSATLLLVSLFLFACDREPVAPDMPDMAVPALGATHETVVFTIYNLQWYTAMDCLGYTTRPAVPGDGVHWTASSLTYIDNYLYLPHDQLPHDRWYAVWSDDLQFETPGGDVWRSVANTYNIVGVTKLYDPVLWILATNHMHEHLIFENAASGARLKITNSHQLAINAQGEVKVENDQWTCRLTRPGK